MSASKRVLVWAELDGDNLWIDRRVEPDGTVNAVVCIRMGGMSEEFRQRLLAQVVYASDPPAALVEARAQMEFGKEASDVS